jgi:hypothetical protein
MKAPWAVSVLFLSTLGAADAAYQERVKKLHAGQAGVDEVLGQLRHSIGFAPKGSGEQEASAEKRGALLQIHAQLSTAALTPGMLLFGRLVNRMVIGADGSPALVEFEAAQGSLSGLRALGVARQAGTPGRISIELRQLLLLGGRAVPLQAVALDPEGAYGLSAQVISGKALAVAGAMASSLISGFAASQQTQAVSALGFSQVQPTGRNGLLQGVAQTAADQSKRLIDEATAEKPVLIVEALTPVTVLVQEEARW